MGSKSALILAEYNLALQMCGMIVIIITGRLYRETVPVRLPLEKYEFLIPDSHYSFITNVQWGGIL